MNIQHGLLLGLLGTSLTIVCFFIAYIIYERNRKREEKIEEEKKIILPYDFK
jgi:uncharacterized membrane protein